MFESINPYTLEKIFNREFDTDAMLLKKLDWAQNAYLTWANTSIEHRAMALQAIATELLEQKDFLAKTISIEMGKPLVEAKAEIEKCADACLYFAQKTESLLSDYQNFLSRGPYHILIQPTGAVFGIMPWNYPFWQAFRYIIPNLMLGNVCLLKHAPNVGLCAQHIENIVSKFLPIHVFQNLWADISQIELIVSHKIVTGTTLTGSNKAGAALAAVSGKYLKKSVLELGGSDAFIVDQNCNIDEVVAQAIKGRLQNNGQTCIAAKRFIIHDDVYKSFKSKLLQDLELLKIGDPLDPKNGIGTIARADLTQKLVAQINTSIKGGANLINKVEYHNNCLNPVVLELDNMDNIAFKEELFGPVFVLKSFRTSEEAIFMANQTDFGLASSIWSNDDFFIRQALSKINAGNVFINQLPKSDFEVPFGGTKMSGYGRELSILGLTEFANIKTTIHQT